MELECTMDEQDVIVLDNGSGFIKVGFSGEDAPRAVLPTAVTTTLLDRQGDAEHAALGDSAAQAKSTSHYGEEALRQHAKESGAGSITWPVWRGEIQAQGNSKEALESLWDHTFRNVLGIEQEELPILIADPLPLGQGTYPSRQWVAEIMFERFKVKSLVIFNTAALSLFSTGRTRGLVVESGEGLTQAVPVFEGYAIPHAINKMEVAGWDITQEVQGMMEKDCPEYSQNPQTMRQLKEKVCSVALDFDAAMSGPDTSDEESRSFELPDGNIIQVGQKIRIGAPEILFSQAEGAPSLQKICLDAINTVDLDLRQDLLRSVVVAGGTSMLPGLAPRLRKELGQVLPHSESYMVDMCVDSQRRYAAWIGGSMFASLSTFDTLAITRQEFEEGKSDVRNLVARKTF